MVLLAAWVGRREYRAPGRRAADPGWIEAHGLPPPGRAAHGRAAHTESAHPRAHGQRGCANHQRLLGARGVPYAIPALARGDLSLATFMGVQSALAMMTKGLANAQRHRDRREHDR